MVRIDFDRQLVRHDHRGDLLALRRETARLAVPRVDPAAPVPLVVSAQPGTLTTARTLPGQRMTVPLRARVIARPHGAPPRKPRPHGARRRPTTSSGS